jgi:hypothetical protein
MKFIASVCIPYIPHLASSPSDLLDSADYAADISRIDLAARQPAILLLRAARRSKV